MRLPALHFQLDHHIPTMASYQTFIMNLSWNANLTNGYELDDLIQPRAQIKLLFEESELASGDSEAIRKFSDKYIVPEKLVAGYAERLPQIKMRKEKKKERTERERMERLNREHNDIDYSDLSCHPWGWTGYMYPRTFPITSSPSKGRKLKRSQWSKRTLACCCTIQWSVNNLGSHRLEICCSKWLHHFPRWKLTQKWCSRSSSQVAQVMITGDWSYTRTMCTNIAAVKIWTKVGTGQDNYVSWDKIAFLTWYFDTWIK